MGFIEGDHFDDEQCFAQLERSNIGRIALSLGAVPVVFPVIYAVSSGELWFAHSVGQVTKALHGNVATLQADGFEEDSGQQWTVLAIGHPQRVEGSEGLGSSAVPPPIASHAASLERGDLFRLRPEILSGRWIETR
jgi:hypothetical protein